MLVKKFLQAASEDNQVLEDFKAQVEKTSPAILSTEVHNYHTITLIEF